MDRVFVGVDVCKDSFSTAGLDRRRDRHDDALFIVVGDGPAHALGSSPNARKISARFNRWYGM